MTGDANVVADGPAAAKAAVPGSTAATSNGSVVAMIAVVVPVTVAGFEMVMLPCPIVSVPGVGQEMDSVAREVMVTPDALAVAGVDRVNVLGPTAAMIVPLRIPAPVTDCPTYSDCPV